MCKHPTCNGGECRRPKPEKKRTRPRPMSDKRSRELALYRKERKKFLQDNPECKAAIFPICDYQATEVHHMAGRENGLLLDKSKWLPICHACHQHITAHSAEAIRQGLSISKHKKAS